MFKHILLPTDGSKLSAKAVKRGIAFAKSLKARVTGIHVVPEFRMMVDEGYLLPGSATLRKRFEDESRERAKKVLEVIDKNARNAGVKCETMCVVSDLPYEVIVKTAKKKKCDLVMMASHGRHGISGLLLGSETAKVLLHATVPVLVVR
ncbi:MAG: universal stress protein [Betaproteobacteria bacterium]|nr:universal stress protein [Betaproteobacteria bacterium]MBI3938553.1 universal stress protein [Betaproteobacteria bacterium]